MDISDRSARSILQGMKRYFKTRPYNTSTEKIFLLFLTQMNNSNNSNLEAAVRMGKFLGNNCHWR